MHSEKGITRDVVGLSNELLYQRYVFNREQIFQFLNELSMQEYVALHIMDETESLAEAGKKKTYLQELSERMNMTIRKTSAMVKHMRERGLLMWSHDGDGSEGTYVVITDSGRQILRRQEALVKKYFSNVILKFGIDRTIDLLMLWRDLEDVMREEISRRENEDE